MNTKTIHLPDEFLPTDYEIGSIANVLATLAAVLGVLFPDYPRSEMSYGGR